MIPVTPPALVEVDSSRRYVSVNDSACDLLGYTRQEMLNLRIDDVSFPTGAHVAPMYQQFVKNGRMQGIFALKRKSGEVLRIQFESEQIDGRSRATWTHYEVWKDAERSRLRE
jgi:PAS domain S-box-containing protein